MLIELSEPHASGQPQILVNPDEVALVLDRHTQGTEIIMASGYSFSVSLSPKTVKRRLQELR